MVENVQDRTLPLHANLNEIPQRQLWRGGSWKYWRRAVVLQSDGNDDDSSDEFSTVATSDTIGVWSQHIVEV